MTACAHRQTSPLGPFVGDSPALFVGDGGKSRSGGVSNDRVPPGARSGDGRLAATVFSRTAEGNLNEEDGKELLWSVSVRDRPARKRRHAQRERE